MSLILVSDLIYFSSPIVHGPICTAEELPQAQKICSALTATGSPFQTCLQKLEDAESIITECLTDVCNVEKPTCASLEELEDQCQAASQPVGEWKGILGCEGSVFQRK